MSLHVDVLQDPRQLQMLAMLWDGGFVAPLPGQPSSFAPTDLGDDFDLDAFAREAGITPDVLQQFLGGINAELTNDPQLLDELNQARQLLGLPPLDGAQDAGLQDPSSLMGEDLVALLVMWALRQNKPQQGRMHTGGMPQQSFSRGQPASWGGGGSGGGGGGPAATGGGGGTGAPTGEHPDLSNLPTGQGTVGDFLSAALRQDGDRYVFGAETNLDDPDPDTFDCSELVQWAAHQAGIEMPDGTMNQEPWLRQHGAQISLEEAINTPGALLYKDGHVAISLGDGRTIEAMGSKYGVKIGNAHGRFTRGYVVPGMDYSNAAEALAA